MHLFDYFLCALLENLCQQAQGMGIIKHYSFDYFLSLPCIDLGI